MRIGVIGFQGAVSEHLNAVKKAFAQLEIEGTVQTIRAPADLDDCDGLIIPGGESTTISRHMKRLGLTSKIKEMANDGTPVMGTCAGCVIIAKELDGARDSEKIELLGLMDIRVRRNAFGRQRESFEKELAVSGFDEHFKAVFIRAPLILEAGGDVEVMAKIDEDIVMARQNNLLAVAFHPELTDDRRIHKMFLELVENQ